MRGHGESSKNPCSASETNELTVQGVASASSVAGMSPSVVWKTTFTSPDTVGSLGGSSTSLTAGEPPSTYSQAPAADSVSAGVSLVVSLVVSSVDGSVALSPPSLPHAARERQARVAEMATSRFNMPTIVGEIVCGPRITFVNQRVPTQGDRLPLLITIGVFVVMLACLPLVWMLDADIDEDRPMYQDMLRMQNLQALNVVNEGRPEDVTATDGEAVKVGASEFTASPGVTVVVRAVDENSFCVSASNDLGERAERCSE